MTRTLLSFLAFLSMTTLDSATANCPPPNSKEIRLLPASGTLKQDGIGNSNWCEWTLRNESLTGHLILLKLTSISLYTGQECLGDLRLTGFAPFCRKRKNSCFIYASSTCVHMVTFHLVNSENCSNLHWNFRSRGTRQVRYRARGEGKKSFTFDYKFISCEQDVKAQEPKVNSTSSTVVSESFMRLANRSAEALSQIHSGISTGTFAGVMVFFIVLLAMVIALLFLLYRRLRKLKSQARSPARVQYELAKPREITVLRLSNTEQSNDLPSRESTFSLHGEHNAMNPQDDETVIPEEPVERNYSAIEDLDFSDGATPTYPTLPLERRQPDSADETCVYATVNKRRATTKR